MFAMLNRGFMYMTYSWFSSIARSRWGQLGVVPNILVAYLADLANKPLVHPLE
jgi:hypothetical protein